MVTAIMIFTTFAPCHIDFFTLFVSTSCVETCIVFTLLSIVRETDDCCSTPTSNMHTTSRHTGGIQTYPRECRPVTAVAQGKYFAHTLLSSVMAC